MFWQFENIDTCRDYSSANESVWWMFGWFLTDGKLSFDEMAGAAAPGV